MQATYYMLFFFLVYSLLFLTKGTVLKEWFAGNLFSRTKVTIQAVSSLCFLLSKLLKTFLESATTSIQAGVAEWLSRWPRDPTGIEKGPLPKRQGSQWAFGSQGFKSLPRRCFSKLY
jgi:hypothetical protein